MHVCVSKHEPVKMNVRDFMNICVLKVFVHFICMHLCMCGCVTDWVNELM